MKLCINILDSRESQNEDFVPSLYLSRKEMKNECYMTGTPLVWLSSFLIQDDLFLRSVKMSLLYSHVSQKRKVLPPGPKVPTEMCVERSLWL